MQRNQGLVPVGGTVQSQQTLMSQQRTVEQRSSSSATMIRESHTRASETHVSQQSFSSQQQSTITSQRVQGMLVQPQHQTHQMIMGQRLEGSPPVFEQIFRNARFAQGGNALFEGKVKGNPTPEVSWTRQGQPISDSNKYQMKYEPETGKVSLLISLIGPGDEGEYTCTAVNPFGEAICTVYIQPEAQYVQWRQEEQAQIQAAQAIPAEEQFQRQLSQTVESGLKSSGTYVRTHYEKTLERNTAGRVEQQSTVSSESYYANGSVIEEDFKVDTFEYRLLREVEFRELVTRLRPGEAPEPEDAEVVQGPIAPPTVGQKPRNSKLLEGSDGIFTVKLSGNPKPKVTWFKNGIRLRPSPRHVMTNANQTVTLKIRIVVPEDSGHYTMLAENPSGCVVSSACLAVEPVGNQDEMQFKSAGKPVENGTANGYPSRQPQPEPIYENADQGKSLGPQFVKVPSDVTVSEGKLVRLDCRVTGRPYPDVVWYLNGHQILDDVTHKILINEAGSHALMITRASPVDTGIITCVAKNKGGESSFQVNLNVIEKEQLVAPKFVERFSTIHVKEGEPVSLNARAVGTPIPSITWQKDGALIQPSPDTVITSDNGYSTLEIPAAKLADSAWYQCTATNVAGSTATRARLFVQAEKAQNQTPRKLTLPKPTKVIEPPPEQEPEVVYLRHVERSRPYQPKQEEERATEPPVFVVPLKDISTFEGDRALFEAKITPVGDPSLRVEWYVDGKPLPASSRINTINRFGYISLTVISLIREDKGIYTCRIINDAGYADSSASLNISPRPQIESVPQHPESIEHISMLEDYSRYQRVESIDESVKQAPHFVKELHDLGDIQEGSYAHFEAQILPVSDPFMRIEWFKDGKPITASSRVNTIYNFGYVALNIMYLRSEDTGMYTVRASNRLGEAVSQASIKVVARSGVTGDLGIPDQERYIERIQELEAYQLQQGKKQYVESIETTAAPEFKTPIKDQIDIREGGFAHFEARLEPIGDPSMRVEWLKDGKPVEASSRITSFFNFGYVALTIKSITVLDRGIYTCRARNAKGAAEVSAKLTVISKKDVIMEAQHPGGLERIQYLEDASRLARSVQEETTVTIAPRFVGGLKGTTKILEGQRAHFEARLEPVNDNTMTVEWYFNGKVIMQASRITTFYDFGYVALDITDVRMEDAGTYTVVAKNSIGEVQLTTQMEVEGRSVVDYSSMHRIGYEKTQMLEQSKHIEPQYHIEEISKSKPVFVQPLNDPAQPVPEGKSVHLECRLEPMGDPTMRVEWFFNGKPITIGSRFKTYFDFGYVALDIIGVTSLDAGEYTVRATNHLGSAHTSACVKIISRSGIISETQNEAVLEQLHYLEDSSRYQRSQQEEVTFNQLPVFTKPLHSIETVEGTNIHLECRLNPVGDPSMRVDWLVNGKPVRTGHRFRPAFDFDYVALDILSVYPEDSGVYTCRAYNRIGESVTSASVKVIAKSELILESQHPAGLEQIQYLEDSSRYRRKEDVDEIVVMRPKFLTKPKSVDSIKEGQNAHFECKLEPVADTNLKVEWLKNGRPITIGHRFRPIHDFGYVALDIIGVIAEDSGVYTCRAVNAVGQDEVQCALQCKSIAQILTDSQSQGLEKFTYLEDKSRYQRSELIEEMCTQAPVFTSSLKNMEIIEGQRAHFECRLIPVSDPTLKVEWFHNKVPLKSGSRFVETNNFGFVALDIMYSFAEDSGTYTCRATNALGESITQCQLLVKSQKSIYSDSQHEGALSQIQYLEDSSRNQRMSVIEDSITQAPVFTQPMKELVLVENQTAHFEARLIPVGDPKLKVEWFRNGVPIQEASRIATMHDFGYVAFDMKYVYPEDSGTYECRARNELGQAVTSATLIVKSKASLVTETQHEEALAKIQYLEDASRYQRSVEEETVVKQAPNFVSPFAGPTKLVEGQSAHFECRIEPYPDPTLKVEFFHNGKPLAVGHRFRTTYDFGFAALDILTCYPEDAGTYTARATNRLGTAESSVTISVTGRSGLILESQHQEALDKIHYLEDSSRHQRREDAELIVSEKPSFGRGLKNQEKLVEGQAVHLEATVTPVNDHNLKVEWFHNGRPITQGHRFKTTYDFGYVALDILYAYPEDSGTYMCRATNSLGEAATTCSIKIEGKSGLILDTLDESRLKKIRELEDVAPIAKEEAQLVISRPNFTTALNSLENLREGDHAHLETRLEPINDPNLKVQWFVNGVEIKTGHRFRTTHDFGYVALDILCAYPEDSGTYMCRATNSLGEAVNTCTITVSARRSVYLDTQHPDGWEKIRALESHPQARPAEISDLPATKPRFITELQGSNQLVEGQTAHLECRLEPIHDPKLRVEFFHNGKPLQSAARFHTTFDFGYVALDIGHVVPEDSGEYLVKAINQLGEATTSNTIRVEAKSSIISESQRPEGMEKIRELEDASRHQRPEYAETVTFQRPVFTAPLHNVDSGVEGGSAHFECRLIPVGDPTLKVEWFRNEQPLEYSSRIQRTHDFGYVALDISYLRPEDEGVYMCRATNSLGEAVTTASIRIKSKASIDQQTLHSEGMKRIQELEDRNYKRAPEGEEKIFEKPVFTAPLTGPSEVNEGQHAHFECRVLPVGDPTLRFEWYVNGVELKMGSRFRVTHDFGYVTLDINNCIPEDAGVYMCKAINHAGEAVSTTPMRVRARGSVLGDTQQPNAWERIQLKEAEMNQQRPDYIETGITQAPHFVTQLTSHERLVENSSIHLDCQVEPKNDANLTIDWFKNGIQLNMGSRIRTTFDFGLVGLDIIGLRPDDSGIYMCKATNKIGEAVTTCTIKVEGRDWLIGSAQRPEALSRIADLEAPRGRPREEAEAVYEAPVFISHLNNVECNEADTAHFECKVEPSKDPTMKIEWYVNGKVLPTAARFNSTYDFGFVSLDIKSVYPEDNGVYTCKATNSKGSAVSTGTLRCTSKSSIYLDTQHPQGMAGLEEIEKAEAAYYAKYQRQESAGDQQFPKPQFIVALQPQFNLGEEESLHLECHVEPKQDPNLKIEWFFNGKLLDHASRFKVNHDFGFVTLDLTDVYTRDQGVYTCRASNKVGEAFTSTTVYCSGKTGLIESTQHPKGAEGLERIQALEDSLIQQDGSVPETEGHAPIFTSQFQNVSNLSEGEIAHFEATLTPVGDQTMKVEWFYNGQVLPASSRVRTVYDFGMVVLEILGTKVADSGEYTCRATNAYGSAEISVKLECVDLAHGQKPQFTTHMKSLEGLRDGDSAHFECTLVPTNDPNLKVEWFHNGQPMKMSSRIKTVSDFGFVVLDIAYVQSHDSGEYVCKATNKYGEDSTRATLKCFGKGGVYLDSLQPDSLARIRELEEQPYSTQTPLSPTIEAPRFVTQIQPVQLVEGQSAHFEARLTPVNDPKLTVEWYVNGKKLATGHRFRTFHDFGIVILDILYCYAEDSGVYECRAVNELGEDTTKTNLRCVSKAGLILDSQLPGEMQAGLQKIQNLEDLSYLKREVAPEESKRTAPVFTVPLSNIDGLKEGENAHFEGKLSPTDDPRMKVEWFHNGKPLKTGSRIRTFCDFGFVILEISPIYPEDSGVYECRATNDYGSAVTSATLKCSGKRNVILESQLPKGMERTIERIAELEGLGARQDDLPAESDSGKPPEFITTPSDLQLPENGCAHFECKVLPVNDPSLRIEWYHNGKPLGSGSRVKTISDFGFVILEISGCYQRDAGLYTCKATNKHGEASVSCTLTVKGRQGIILEPQLPQKFRAGNDSILKLEETLWKREEAPVEEDKPNPPRFVTELNSVVDHPEGSPVHFECRVEPANDPRLRIDWYHNGRPLDLGSRIHALDDFGFVVLDMDWTFERDSGEYICRATNKWGTAVTKATLTLTTKRNVVVDSQLPDGMTGAKLKELERGPVSTPFAEDAPAEPPRFVTHIQSLNVEEGEAAHFECRVTPKNDPRLRIEWYFNGKPLQMGHRFRTMYEMGFVSLDILYTYPEDNGEYVCIARNTAGTDKTIATISCKKIPAIIMQNQMPKGMKKSEALIQMEAALKKYTSEIHLTGDDIYDADKRQPPRFVTHIKDQLELVEMQATKFECQLAPVGDPNMRLEWFFNGKPLPFKNRFTPIYDFGYVAMNFGWVYPEDSGEYVCRATNLYGSDETRAVIKTSGKPGIIYESQLPKGMQSVEKIREMEAAWQRIPDEPEEGEKPRVKPAFVTKPENVEVVEGEMSRFCCRVTGYPRPRVMWLINGHAVMNGTRYKLTYDGMWHLDIPKTRQYDNGKVEVLARNSAGEAYASAELKVRPRNDDYRNVLKNSPKQYRDTKMYRKPDWVTRMEEIQAQLRANQQPPLFTTQLLDVYIRESESAKFECYFTGNPVPDVTFYHNGKPLMNSKQAQARVKNDRAILNLFECTREMEGEYSCKAFSKAGEMETKAILHIAAMSDEERREWEAKKEKEMAELLTIANQRKEAEEQKKMARKSKKAEYVAAKRSEKEAQIMEELKKVEKTADTEILKIEEVVEVLTGNWIEQKLVKVEPTIEEDLVTQKALRTNVALETMKLSETGKDVYGRIKVANLSFHKDVAVRATCDAWHSYEDHAATYVTSEESGLEVFEFKFEMPRYLPSNKLEMCIRFVCDQGEFWDSNEGNNYTLLPPYAFHPSLVPGVKTIMHLATMESVNISEIASHVDVSEFAPGENPLADIAKLGVMVDNGVTISQVMTCMESGDLPTLRTPEAQRGLIKLAEQISETAIVTKVLCEEAKGLIEKTPVGLKAFLKMAEVVRESANIQEIATQLAPKEFHGDAKPVKEIAKVSLMLKEGVTSEEVINMAQAGELPALVKPESQLPLIRMVGQQGHSAIVAQVIVEESASILKDEQPRPEYQEITTEPEPIEFKKANVSVPEVKGKERPIPADFVEYFDDLKVVEGANVKFTAKFVGSPAPEVIWYRNGKKVKGSKNVIVATSEGVTSLEIVEARIDKDAGEYNCAIHNNAGKAICGALLEVSKPLSIFVRGLTNIEVDERTEVVLTCELRKATRVRWYKDGKEIKHTSRIEMIDDGYQHRLVILSTQMADSGVYQVVAETETSESKLLVKEAPATFVKKLQDLETKEREAALLEVEVSKEKAEVTWHKDGEPLKLDSGKYEVKSLGKKKQLIIRSVSIHDEGEYTCSLGENECTAELAVIELPPEIIKKLEDTTVARGETATFEIELTKGDALVRWFKDGKEINFDNRIQLQIDGKKQRLTISRCVIEDSSAISCSVGDVSSSARLTVEAPAVEFLGRLPDVTTVMKGNEATFTVTVSQEDVEVSWFRNKTQLKPSDKYTITVDGAKRTLVIKDSQSNDADKYTCKLGKLKTTSTLVVEVLQVAPKVQEESLKVIEKVKKGQDVTFNIPYTAEPEPKVQWFFKNQPIKKGRKHLPAITEGIASITIHSVEEVDCGKYTCKLSNACGDVTVDVTLQLLEKPSAPGTPESLLVTDSSIKLHWKAPETDGGCTITTYRLEYCEKSSKKWIEANKDRIVVETQFEITNLTKNAEYSFRVSAVNEVGEGPKSNVATFKITAPIKPEAPVVVEPLKDTIVGLKQKVTLSCVINGVPEPTVAWFKDGKELKSGGASYQSHVAKLVIKETVESSAATYICRASNKAGNAETSCRLTVQEVPKVEVEKKQRNQKLQVDSQFKVVAKISGYPLPDVTWTKDGVAVEEDSNCAIIIDETDSTLIIKSLERCHSGKYVCMATNAAGSGKEEIVLKVIDKPSKPEALVVKKVDEAVVLEWKPPADDGGLDISKYSIEKLDLDKRQWMKVADVESSINSYTIQDLTEGSEYLFRVVACNPVGLSEAIESETVVIKSAEDKPSAPRGPFEISGMTDYSLVLKWLPPEFDGGYEILEYLVEKRETTKKAWQKVGSTDGNTTYIEVTHLKKSISYHFRVTAKNCKGYGAPYSPDEGIIVGKRITPPSMPTNLRVVDVTSRSVTLQWGPPGSTGGTELTGYVVEKRVEGGDRWEKVVTLEPSVSLYIVQNLKERSEKLYFRVTAENSMGYSEPAETKEVALKTHATVPTPPTAPLEMRPTGPHSIIVEWGEPESDGGAPIEGYVVAARDTRKTMWMEVGTVEAGVTRLNIKDMQEGHSYDVRVFARNEVGLSEPLESDEPIRVVRPPGYHEGEPVDEADQEVPSVSFSTETLSSWMKEAGMDADIKFYARSALLQRDEYFFRIWIYAKKLFQ